MDLLLIELVPLAKRLSSNPPSLRDDTFIDLNPPNPADLDDDSEREHMYFRLEPLGFRVGQGIAERSFPTIPLCTTEAYK
jgi:trafficking protein particle complex subunit 6